MCVGCFGAHKPTFRIIRSCDTFRFSRPRWNVPKFQAPNVQAPHLQAQTGSTIAVGRHRLLGRFFSAP